MSTVPASRLRAVNDAPVEGGRGCVLYWMTATRRPRFNFALDRAVEHAVELKKPLLVLEALRTGYPWASDRHHRFILDGMRANREAFADAPVRYFPYVETASDAGKGLLEALAKDACVVVTDDWPNLFFPQMVAAAGRKLDVRLEAVDSCGLLPFALAEKAYPTAYFFRRFLQKTLPDLLGERPRARPFDRRSLPNRPSIPRAVLKRWPEATTAMLEGRPGALDDLPIDHEIEPTEVVGGEAAGRARLEEFLDHVLGRYAEDRNQPDEHATSELSPYLHYGHVSTHEVFARLVELEDWTPDDLAPDAKGKRAGWWGMSEGAEAFLDQVVTWREVGLNFQAIRGDADVFESLPDWARASLGKHAADPRPHLYDVEAFETAATHDDIWNAAQRQLRREGKIHNYLRMLWAKKVLEWSPTPQAAWDVLLRLNDRWALDGRDPNSYSGIGWSFGRYDRPWAPERPIFGVIRFMSSASAARKLRLRDYLATYGDPAGATGDLFDMA